MQTFFTVKSEGSISPVFSESLPHPSDLHAELPAHLTPTGGSSQKTQPNISQIFLISLAMTNDTSKQERPSPGSIDGFRQLEKSQALNSHWMGMENGET